MFMLWSFNLLLSNAENTKNFTQVEYTTPITDYLSDEKVNELGKKGACIRCKRTLKQEN